MNKTSSAQKPHRWTDAERQRLRELVEVDFAEFVTDGRPDPSIWDQMPGRLSLFVSPRACQQQYERQVRGRTPPAPSPTASAVELSALVEVVETCTSLIGEQLTALDGRLAAFDVSTLAQTMHDEHERTRAVFGRLIASNEAVAKKLDVFVDDLRTELSS